MMGINASIVGILLAALYNPVITNSIHSVLDWCAAVGAFALLMFCRRVPWVVILLIGGAAIFYHSIGT
jgi:chromate transporter